MPPPLRRCVPPTAPRPSPPSSPSPDTSTAASRLSAALARAVSVAIAGAGYCVVAADTRLSVGYSVLSRDHSKIVSLADKCVLASSEFQGDIKALQKNLAAKELDAVTPLSESDAVDLVKDVFASATERDYTLEIDWKL